MKPEVVQALEFCDLALREKVPELTVPREDIQSLRDEPSRLLYEIREQDDLDDQLRAYLIDQLSNVLDALDSYLIGGTEPLGQ